MAKTKKINWKSKKTWKNVLLIGLACITIIGAIVGLSALFRKAEETTKEINPSYNIGALDLATGKYVESDGAIYTKDGFECQGLTTTLDFDAIIKYQLYFYDEYDEFIHTTGTMDGVFYSTGVPVYAKYVRVVIIPNEDENINWFEKFDYAKQLTIKVNKEQNFKSFGENLYKIDSTLELGSYYDPLNGVTIKNDDNMRMSSEIVCTKKHNSLFIQERSIEGRIFRIYLYNLDGTYNRYFDIDAVANKSYSVSTGVRYYTYKLSSDIGSFRVVTGYDCVPEVYLY